jgi:FkbM family methyltransferase
LHRRKRINYSALLVQTMNIPAGVPAPESFPRLRATGIFRALNRCLPLGRKYHRFISLVNPTAGLVAIPFGKYEVVHPASWGSETAAVLLSGEDLIPEFRLLPPILKELKGGHLIDIGANVGLYVLMLRANSPLPIIAYEPQPFLCGLVESNVAHNHLPQVDVRHLACGAAPGELLFQTGINGGIVADAEAKTVSPSAGGSPGASLDQQAEETRHARPVIRVPVTTLDADLKDTPVALMKIDCEGFEHHILAGGMNLLQKQRPILLLELHPQQIEQHGGTPRQVLDVLRPLYDIEFWDFNLLRHRPKLVRSALKHRRPAGHRFASEAEMLKACDTEPRPFQVYLLCRPKKG